MLNIYPLRLCSKWTQVIISFSVTSRSWIFSKLVLQCRFVLEVKRSGRSCRGATLATFSLRFCSRRYYRVLTPLVILRPPRFLNFSISLFPSGTYLSFFCLHSRRSPRVLRLTSHRIVISHPYTIKYIT